MSDHKDNKTNPNNDELSQVKSLIGDTDGGQFELDDILAEYGSRKSGGHGAVPLTPGESGEELDLPFPAARPRPVPDNVVAFPGAAGPEQEQEAPVSDGEPPSGGELSPEEDSAGEEPEQDNVIQFPEEESALSAFLKDITRKADRYADQMFAEDERTDPEEVRRLERLIPGTDQEAPKEPPREEKEPYRRPRHQTPPPPDYSPQELVKRYGKKLKGLRLRSVTVFLLALISLVQIFLPFAGISWPAPLSNPVLQGWIAVGLMGLGLLLGIDVLWVGLVRAFHLRVGMDTLAALSCVFTLADGLLLVLSPEAPARLPYTAVALSGLFFLLHGTYHYKCGLRLSCRTAASSSTPYRITLDEGKWNGQNTYTKWSGSTDGFGSQIQADDGAQRIFSRFCPFVLIADVVLALVNSLMTRQPQQIVWCLSALFTSTAAFGSALVYGRPFHKVVRRLAKSGAVLAGWPGVANSRRGNRVLVTDGDLFPPGYVELNGYKVMAGFSAERVLTYTATLIKASGSGLTQLFVDQLRAMGGMVRSAERLCCYEGGGLSANIRGDQVLVGSADFMSLMEVSLPEGIRVKSAAFCAINGELAGIFALNYSLPDTVFPALEELMEEKVGPVLATRDFNLIPAMLHQRFKLAADKMDFPPVERRRELSDDNQPHSDTLTALLCREGLFPYAETIAAAKRLRWATRLGAVLCCMASLLGLVLAAYLTSVSAFTSLSPVNLFLFMFIWLAPVWFLSGWVHHY